MTDFSLSDVARLAGLPEARVRALVEAGVLEPHDPAEAEGRFSFRDVVLCRSARRLAEADVSLRRLTDALSEIKARLPEAHPLSGVAVLAEGRQVVARDGQVCWEVDSGQVRFDFGEPARFSVPPVVRLARGFHDPDGDPATDASMMTSHEWFELGLDLEPKHPDQARDAYRRALELDPLDRDARLNLARLLRNAGQVEAAEAQYRLVSDLHPDDARSVYDLGLLLEGQARWWDAVAAYESAAQRAPRSPDVYRRLAALYERLGEATQAVKALKTYRALVDATPDDSDS